ncbi:MAG: UbiA family prenyltransferase [Bacteroidales bacterium]
MTEQNEYGLTQDLGSLKFYQIINIMSIDIVIGSVLSGACVVKIFNLNPGWAWWVVLPLSVWVVYTLDHLLDAVKLGENSHTLRHRFHFKHFKFITQVLIFVTLLIFAIVVFFLKREIIVFGMLTAFVCMIYLIVVYFKKNVTSNFLQKEIFVAFIYTIGIWGGPLSLLHNLHLTEALLLIVFFVAALIDILIFSIYEMDSDALDHHNSFPIKYGEKFTIRIVYILCALAFAICIYQFIMLPYGVIAVAFKILMLMILILSALLGFRQQLSKNNYYRTIGELVFWLPGLIMLY